MVDNYIRKVRVEKGLTQKDLAKKMKVTQGQISQWERSDTLRMSTIDRIAEALGCDSTQLVSAYTRIDLELSDEDYERIKQRAIKEGRPIPPKHVLGSPQPLQGEYPGFWNEDRLWEAYFKLNDMGKHEAIKRVEELTQIKKYTE